MFKKKNKWHDGYYINEQGYIQFYHQRAVSKVNKGQPVYGKDNKDNLSLISPEKQVEKVNEDLIAQYEAMCNYYRDNFLDSGLLRLNTPVSVHQEHLGTDFLFVPIRHRERIKNLIGQGFLVMDGSVQSYRILPGDRQVSLSDILGTGVIEAALAISTGLIITAALTTEGGSIFTALSYWVIGITLLILTAYIYALIVPYNLMEQIERDNVAVGIGFAGALVAIANLIRFALSHDFVSWDITFKTIGIDVGIGLLFLPVARWLTDKILLPGQNLTDELINQKKPNVGAGLIEAFAYIAGSIIITWSM